MLLYRKDPGAKTLSRPTISYRILIGKLHFCQAHIETQLAKAELALLKDLNHPPHQRPSYISTACLLHFKRHRVSLDVTDEDALLTGQPPHGAEVILGSRAH